MSDIKQCIKCGEYKDKDDFYVIKGVKQNTCKACFKKINHERHKNVFKHNANIYQSILYRMGLKTKLHVDEVFIDEVVDEIANDEEFELKYLESARKRILQRSNAITHYKVAEFNDQFRKIVNEIRAKK